MTNSSRHRRTKPRLLGALAAVAVACGMLAPVAGVAQTASAATVPAAQQYVPTRVPDRVVLTPAADAATAQSVTWRTSTAVTSGQARAEIRVAVSQAYRTDVTTVPAAENTTIDSGFGYQTSYHTVRFTGLSPKTKYQYRVGDGTTWSEWQHFSTAAKTAEPFSFIYLGDVQNGIKSDASRVIRNAFRDRPDAKMVLQAGDLIDSANDDSQWGEVFKAAGYQFGEQNYLAAAGNHEYEGDTLSRQWQAQFDYPANGPKDAAAASVLDGTVHYNDYQGVRFVSLNSNITESKALAVQTAWLESVLKDNPNQWTVVYFHHPVFSLDEGRNNTAIRQAWVPLFEKYNVDLVLQGHDHNYGRGNSNAAEKDLPAGWNNELNYDGPVYAVSVVGSKMYSNAGPRLWTSNDAHLRKLKGDTELYQLIDVSGGTLRYEARTADGQYYDGLTIVKNAAGKAVTDDSKPDKIDGNTSPCLGCTPNPDPGGENPGTENPDQTVDYRVVKQLSSVNKSNAQLPAGSAYSQSKKRLYLGDQNGRSIFELDPDTDAVTRSMTLPENIRDLGIDDEKQLLYVGQQNRNWVVVSIADANFGQVVRGPYTFIESNRSIDVDPVAGLVYGAIPSRGVEVLNASDGKSLGVINGTADAYYVAADPKTGIVTTAYFRDADGAVNVAAFDPKKDYAQVWEKVTRPNARQLDVDSAHGLVYVGYTGTATGSGGFSVLDIATGKQLGDFADPKYGKDGYGISVDEERQRVFVSNRDFRLNPPGSESTAVAVTMSERVLDDTFEYTPSASIVSVNKSNAQLPAGSAYSQSKKRLYLGDQNSRSIFELDPDTDTVTRSMTLPENIRDLGIDDEKQLLYVGQQNRNWVVVSIADANFGQVVRGPYAFIESNRSIDVDPVAGLVYGAIPSRGVEVLNALDGKSLGVINGTVDSYYVAADPKSGIIATAYFEDADGAINIAAFDPKKDYAQVWEKVTRPNARQLDIDSAHGLVYVGYTGTAAGTGGFSVHRIATGDKVADLADPKFGKDGYGISVDEERQRVFVSNRDFRLNPPGSESKAVAVTISQRNGVAPTNPGTDPGTDPGTNPGTGTPPAGTGYTPTALKAVPSATDNADLDVKPVGSVVDPVSGHLFVGNEMRPARVLEIDPVTDKLVATHAVPGGEAEGVRDVAIDSAKGELYVAYGAAWAVLDTKTDTVKRGPFTFAANVRGLDVDLATGRVFGATRQTGFQVMDAYTGAAITTVDTAGAANWTSHGIAVDTVANRLYVTNDNAAGTEGVRVYDATTYALLQTVSVAKPDYRSIAVDPAAGRLYIGHSTDTFEASGVRVLKAADLTEIANFSAHAYGNKVYGVSVDASKGVVYVSARDRYPAALIALQRAAK
ncbi:metallophosphoesterase [Leifsonia aquatica]|uniref:metallophosphoesterase n=1 Tax=Leifsonia aquatica TaxID=144185 RepID=UPI00046894F0|nr:metallophosphoesterase [Leifsonia aquatica]